MKRKFSPSRLIKFIQFFLWGWFILGILASLLSFNKMTDSGWIPWSCPHRIEPNYSKIETFECKKYFSKYPESLVPEFQKELHWECYQSYEDYYNYRESINSEKLCNEAQNNLTIIIFQASAPLLTFYVLYYILIYLFPKQTK